MNFDQFPKVDNSKKEIVKTPENKIKEGVDFVFEQSPTLFSIGTKEQYSEYLSTIFPDSRVKDIILHGTSNFEGDRFDKSKSRFGVGFYFANKKYLEWDTRGEIIIPVTINVDYKLIELPRLEFRVPNAEIKEKEKALIEGYNSLLITNEEKNQEYYIVFEPEQIHILGSKEDIAGFKDFVSKNEEK